LCPRSFQLVTVQLCFGMVRSHAAKELRVDLRLDWMGDRRIGDRDWIFFFPPSN
jgi:hypothetical protein